MAGYERLKSVAGGGRYDALASDGRTTYPGVGISFGVSRTLVPLFADGALAPGPKVPSRCWSPSSTRSRAAPARRSRPRCAAAASPPRSPRRAQKFGKQIRYAERRGIPYVWFPDSGTRSRTSGAATSSPADPATWTPTEETDTSDPHP